MDSSSDSISTAKILISNEVKTGPIPARVFGNFLEHLGFSLDGGILAQALANPTFERDARLDEKQVSALVTNAERLVRFYQTHGDPGVFPEHWSPGIGATGFGVAALDDFREEQIPFPWAPMGGAGLVKPSVGRLGGAIRLVGQPKASSIRLGEGQAVDEGSTGIRQGIFLPFQRCLSYNGHVWVRIASMDPSQAGTLVVGFQRRLGETTQRECLAVQQIDIHGCHWQKLPFTLDLSSDQVSPGEPVDFFIRWLPQQETDLLIDRAMLLPADAVDGLFDPDVLRLVREWRVPLLRWPGGNFVSHYHWRDGTGPIDRRPTRPNFAWGGLEYNFFGTSEFIHFCRLVNAEPHIVVNTGTGTAEEAAAWVEYCNGSPDTEMGALRAINDTATAYHVKLWEVGNETYGSWQGGFHGAEENALRYKEYSAAMHKVDPLLELIATGNQFDIAQPGPGLDHTQADRLWNQTILEMNPEGIDYLSLHCLPANDLFLEQLSDEQAYYSLMAQPDSWEKVFIPDILRIAGQVSRTQTSGRKPPLRIAITEWGVLGSRGKNRPVVENYGEVPYAGIFLNMVMRNCAQISISNATALLHGGCIRKAGGQVFFDPQYLVIQKYTQLAGANVLQCTVESPMYDMDTAPDLGLPIKNVPWIDVVSCQQPDTGKITVCVVNRHLHQSLPVQVTPQTSGMISEVTWEFIAHPDVSARARLGDPNRFVIQKGNPIILESGILVELPPCSVSWISYPTQSTQS